MAPEIEKLLPALPPAPPLPGLVVDLIPSELRIWEKLPFGSQKLGGSTELVRVD